MRWAMLSVLALLLAGCAYKPLKAPCAADEDNAPVAAERPPRKPPAAYMSLDSCGPLRPI